MNFRTFNLNPATEDERFGLPMVGVGQSVACLRLSLPVRSRLRVAFTRARLSQPLMIGLGS